MNGLQNKQCSAKTHKRSISKVTTCKSSTKNSTLKEDFEGVVKSKAFQTKYPYQPERYIKALRKTMILFPQVSQNQLKNTRKQSTLEINDPINQQIWKFIMSILDRFDFNGETIALGVGFYLKLMFSTYPIDQRPLHLKKFHLSGCIYLAAKSIEIEMKIPKFSDYQYFCGQNFTSQDYNKFQRFLILTLQYDLQKSTLLTFLRFYLSIGIFYQSQIFEIGKEIEELENEILQKGFQSLKSCTFLENQFGNPEHEAIKIIREVRKKYHLTEQCKIFRSFSNDDAKFQAQMKRSTCFSSSNSMGRLLNSRRDSSFFTQRLITLPSMSVQRQNQKVVLLEKQSPLRNNLGTVSGSQILRRKPNLMKNNTRKETFQARTIEKNHEFKYVSLKNQNSSCKKQIIAKQLIKCQSVSIIGPLLINGAVRYQKNNLNINSEIKSFQSNSQGLISTTASINSKSEIRTESALLNPPFQSLKKVSIKNAKNVKKLSKLEEQDEDRIIEKSKSSSKSHSKSKFKEQKNLKISNGSKYFHRKSNCSLVKNNGLNHCYSGKY